jgi:hypothetical protein
MKEKECILWLTFWKYRIPIGLCPLCSPSIAAIATFKIVLSQNTHPFPRLSYVCPEPVLAKRSLFVLKSIAKKAFSAPLNLCSESFVVRLQLVQLRVQLHEECRAT